MIVIEENKVLCPSQQKILAEASDIYTLSGLMSAAPYTVPLERGENLVLYLAPRCPFIYIEKITFPEGYTYTPQRASFNSTFSLDPLSLNNMDQVCVPAFCTDTSLVGGFVAGFNAVVILMLYKIEDLQILSAGVCFGEQQKVFALFNTPCTFYIHRLIPRCVDEDN